VPQRQHAATMASVSSGTVTGSADMFSPATASSRHTRCQPGSTSFADSTWLTGIGSRNVLRASCAIPGPPRRARTARRPTPVALDLLDSSHERPRGAGTSCSARLIGTRCDHRSRVYRRRRLHLSGDVAGRTEALDWRRYAVAKCIPLMDLPQPRHTSGRADEQADGGGEGAWCC
jgi:hypothetical protein